MKLNAKQSALLLVLITYVAFISLGLPDGLLGVSWPAISESYRMPIDSLGIVLIVFMAGYLSTSTLSGKLLQIIPLGILLSLSSLITGLSLLAYTYSASQYILLLATYFLGTGGGAIDTSINIFAAKKFSASMVNWLHAFYGIGATLGPLIVTLMLYLGKQWSSGYIAVAVIQVSLSIVFLLTLKYWKSGDTEEEEDNQRKIGYFQTFKQPNVLIGVCIFFIYVGLEVSVGQWIFTILTKSRGIDPEIAGLLTSAYWGSLTAGRILFGFVLAKIPVNTVLRLTLLGLVFGAFLLALSLGVFISIVGIMIIGFSNAPIFPSLISTTPARVGKELSGNVISFQVSAAMLGGAFLPAFAGYLTKHFGVEAMPKLFVLEAVLLFSLYLISIRSEKNSERTIDFMP